MNQGILAGLPTLLGYPEAEVKLSHRNVLSPLESVQILAFVNGVDYPDVPEVLVGPISNNNSPSLSSGSSSTPDKGSQSGRNGLSS